VERDYFQEEGIDLQRVEFASAADAMLPLSTGELDAGIGSYSAAFFNALAREIRLYLVLDAAHLEPGSAGLPLMVAAGSAAGTAGDLASLRGKRVGQPARGVITEWALDRMLAEVGLGLDDTESVLMPFPDMLAALAGGQIQAAVMPEPFATLGERRGVAVRAQETGDYLPGAQIAVTLFSERFARERQEVADRWAVAYLRGGRDYMDAIEHGRDREAVMALLARASGLDRQVLDRIGHYPLARDGRINVDTTLAMLDWMVQHGYVPQKPDIVALLNPRFAEHARQALDSRR
jgi:NitT/TauT family transport system substrate-binding protein